MRKIISIVLTMMLLGFALAGCGQSQSLPKNTATGKAASNQPRLEAQAAKQPQQETKKELKKVSMATPSDALYLVGPIHMAIEKGFYAQEGIAPELVTMQASTTLAGLVSGEVNYSFTISSALRGATQGLPIKAIMSFITGHNWSFMSSPEIKSPEQLKGKTVAVTGIGDTTHQISALTLRKLGLDPQRDVNFFAAGPSSQLVTTFMTGAFAAASVSEPLASMLKTKGYNELISTSDVIKEMTGFGLVTSEKRLAENPDEVKAVLRAALRGLKYFEDPKHEDESIDFIAKQFKVDQDIARSSYKSTLRVMNPNGTITKAQYDATIELAKEELGLKEGQTLPFEQVVNLKPLEQVQKELGL